MGGSFGSSRPNLVGHPAYAFVQFQVHEEQVDVADRRPEGAAQDDGPQRRHPRCHPQPQVLTQTQARARRGEQQQRLN